MSKFASQFAALFRGAPRRIQALVVGSFVFAALSLGPIFSRVGAAGMDTQLSALLGLIFASVLLAIVAVAWNFWILRGNSLIWILTILGSIGALIQAGTSFAMMAATSQVGVSTSLPSVAWSLFTFYALLSPVSKEYRKSRA
jgi:hypothetical protein